MIGKTIKGVWALLEGVGVTVRFLCARPVTLKYPEEKCEPFPRYRGAHVLVLDEKGKVRCVGCALCVLVCPAQVIAVEAMESNDHEKYPLIFSLDRGRCIFCGFCVEACPKGAIRMSTAYELAEYRKEDLPCDKERLIKAGESNPVKWT